MAEKPILFNTEMVRAILDGRKTQTRRLVKTKHRGAAGFNVCFSKATGEITGVYDFDEDERMYDDPTQAPYQPGDVLYVRETFCGYYLPSPENWPEGHMHYEYKASNPNGNKRPTGPEYDDDWEERPWRPSIHMPKEAARLFLRVTGVRCERLRDITAMDAFNEGTGRLFLEDIAYGDKDYECDVDDEYGVAREQFAWLWESTLKKDDLECYGWWANPWVWVIEFERCEKP
jgi:hypothetical protein